MARQLPTAPKRVDAQRNVVALLEAAKAVFAASGVDAPARQITDLAGLGVGTLYRHFPRRADLIVAVLEHELDACVADAEALSTSPDAWAALTTWFERYCELVATKSGLATALHSGDPAYDGLPQRLLDRLAPAAQRLLDRAVAAAVVRADLDGAEVLTALSLLQHPVAGRSADFSGRMTRIFVAGLRVGESGQHLHAAPPDGEL